MTVNGAKLLRDTIRLHDLEATGSIFIDGADLADGTEILQERSVYAMGGITLSGEAPVQLTLPIRPRHEVMVDGQPDLFRALSWNTVLTKLRGRDAEREELLDWATDESKSVAVRLLSGSGGSGKTRLAAETAVTLGQADWAAGFLPRGATSATRLEGVGSQGLFLVIDYPEEYPDSVLDNLISALASEEGSPRPVRVLLLSRRDASRWDQVSRRLKGRFDSLNLDSRSLVTPTTAREIVADAADSLATLMGKPLPSLVDADAWLSPGPDEPERRLPLFAAAAGLHAALAPEDAFGLSGAQLMNDLARRELDRVRGVAVRLGLRNGLDADVDDGLARFLALATVNGYGLCGNSVLEMQSLEIVPERSPKGILRALRSTSWWRTDTKDGGRLAPLVPDRLAAAFVANVLLPDAADKTDLPDLMWMSARQSVEVKGAAYGDIVSRLAHDLHMLGPDRREAFETALLAMLRDDPNRARYFLDVAQSENTSFSVAFSARVLEILKPYITDPSSKAILLSNLSAFMSQLGDRWAALETGREALEARRSLATAGSPESTWDLAMILNNVACFLADCEQPEEAVQLCEEAVEIRRSLAAERPTLVDRPCRFDQDLVDALNNLATFQAELGLREQALATIEEALQLWRKPDGVDREAFEATLAMLQDNLSKRLMAVNRTDAAAYAAAEACELRRELAQAKPHTYKTSLASSLNTHANVLQQLGEWQTAIAQIQEALSIYRFLYASRPLLFAAKLANALNDAAGLYLNVGQLENARDAAEDAVRLYRDLLESRRRDLEKPNDPTRPLAIALQTLSGVLSSQGHNDEALNTVIESSQIWRGLVDTNPDAHLPSLSACLCNLAVLLLNSGQFEAAVASAKEATNNYGRLVKSKPGTFRAELANSSNTLAGCLSEIGEKEEALNYAEAAVALYRSIVEPNSNMHTPSLAMSLETLAKCLNDMGRFTDAAHAVEEAGKLHLQLTQTFPGAAYPALAHALTSLACYHMNAGQYQLCITAAKEAVVIGRKLVATRPELTSGLAHSLTVLADALLSTGHAADATAVAEEAVDHYRSLATAVSGPLIFDLARSLHVLSKLMIQQVNHVAARECLEEAINCILSSNLDSFGAYQTFVETLGNEYILVSTSAGSEPDMVLLSRLLPTLDHVLPAPSGPNRNLADPT